MLPNLVRSRAKLSNNVRVGVHCWLKIRWMLLGVCMFVLALLGKPHIHIYGACIVKGFSFLPRSWVGWSNNEKVSRNYSLAFSWFAHSIYARCDGLSITYKTYIYIYICHEVL